MLAERDRKLTELALTRSVQCPSLWLRLPTTDTVYSVVVPKSRRIQGCCTTGESIGGLGLGTPSGRVVEDVLRRNSVAVDQHAGL